MSVRVERNDAVVTIVLDRPRVRNAIDRDTAARHGITVAQAFRVAPDAVVLRRHLDHIAVTPHATYLYEHFMRV